MEMKIKVRCVDCLFDTECEFTKKTHGKYFAMKAVEAYLANLSMCYAEESDMEILQEEANKLGKDVHELLSETGVYMTVIQNGIEVSYVHERMLQPETNPIDWVELLDREEREWKYEMIMYMMGASENVRTLGLGNTRHIW